MGRKCFASGVGIYSSREILFLRNVVQGSVRSGNARLDNQRLETIARHVLHAYRRGVEDEVTLVEIARQVSSFPSNR